MSASSSADMSTSSSADMKTIPHKDLPASWNLPYELTLEIALMLEYPRRGESKPYFPPPTTFALHQFRLVCSSFARIGKQAIAVIANGSNESTYTTLCLPPKSWFPNFVKMFTQNGDVLTKLITTIRIVLVPSEVHGSFDNALDTFARFPLDQLRTSPKKICLDDYWYTFLASFPNISRIEITTPRGLGRNLEYNFEDAWGLVKSIIHSFSLSSVKLDNFSADENDPDEIPPHPSQQAWAGPAEEVLDCLPFTSLLSLTVRIAFRAYEEDVDPFILKMLSNSHSLEDLSLHTGTSELFGPGILSALSKSANIKTLTLADFVVTSQRQNDNLIRFLLAHRNTLRKVEIDMHHDSESWLWETVETMRRHLTLESCKLAAQAYRGATGDLLMPQLRNVIRRFGGPELAVKDDENIVWRHGVALDRYILGQPALSE